MQILLALLFWPSHMFVMLKRHFRVYFGVLGCTCGGTEEERRKACVSLCVVEGSRTRAQRTGTGARAASSVVIQASCCGHRPLARGGLNKTSIRVFCLAPRRFESESE